MAKADFSQVSSNFEAVQGIFDTEYFKILSNMPLLQCLAASLPDKCQFLVFICIHLTLFKNTLLNFRIVSIQKLKIYICCI